MKETGKQKVLSVAYFKILSYHKPGDNEEDYKNFSQDSQSLVSI
jgi:hypothetical protein